MRIAVIGSGISGLGAAWLAHHEHDVRLFEKSDRIGGHAHTHHLTINGQDVSVDTGFIVYNHLNYPNLVGLFDRLGVETIASDMSLSISLDDGDFEYEGSLRGLFGQPRNLFRRRFWSMLAGLISFYRTAYSQMDTGPEDETVAEFVSRCGYSEAFVHDHLLPMGGAIWSCPAEAILAYPVRSFIQFMENHQLMEFFTRPQWRTVKGGSAQYVQKITSALGSRIQNETNITGIRRAQGGVLISIEGEGEVWFDKVILATHADQALELMTDAAPDEHDVLSSFGFSDNHVILHSDPAVMPSSKSLWASWNYRAEGEEHLSVTYWMNRLQSLDPSLPLFVSLNPKTRPDERHIHAEIDYRHPLFDISAITGQRKLKQIQGQNHIYWCGAWTQYGFHEDGLKSAVATAKSLGITVPWDSPTEPWHDVSDSTQKSSA